jgi:hypothetical protein
MTAAPTPTAAADRLAVLDVLRGFALLGILLANVPVFGSTGRPPAGGWDADPTALHRAARWLTGSLVAGKFNAIFSLLFGVGFALFLDRAEAKGAPAVGLYLRQLGLLFLFGVAHLLPVWSGEILHKYVLLGWCCCPCGGRPTGCWPGCSSCSWPPPLTYRYTLATPQAGAQAAADATEQTRVYGGPSYRTRSAGGRPRRGGGTSPAATGGPSCRPTGRPWSSACGPAGGCSTTCRGGAGGPADGRLCASPRFSSPDRAAGWTRSHWPVWPTRRAARSCVRTVVGRPVAVSGAAALVPGVARRARPVVLAGRCPAPAAGGRQSPSRPRLIASPSPGG